MVARLTPQLKGKAAAIRDWQTVDDHYAVGEFTAQLLGWSVARRFVVVRERVREDKAAVGRKLLDVPGFTVRLWVTNRTDAPWVLWRDYNGRATIKQRIEELKNDLAADDFCTQNFWATEAAFLAVLFTFNLLSLYQQNASPSLVIVTPPPCGRWCSCVAQSWAAPDGKPCSTSRLPGADWTSTSPCSKPSSNGRNQLRRS